MVYQALTWSLVIATYQREHILLRCLQLAAKQTRLPQEVIVVDASPGYEKTRDLVIKEFSFYPDIKLVYVKANYPSLTAQRNQGIKLASSDILFLIDDDSLMYLDCAEEVLKIYEADVEARVKGISPIGVKEPPDSQDLNQQYETQGITCATEPPQTLLRRTLKAILKTTQTYFLAYDEDFPNHEVPPEISQFNIGIIQVMAGYSMTFRREIFSKEQFSEILSRYAAGEDQDLSYRVSRHGLLLNAVHAKLCHLAISGGRLSTYTVTVLAALNPAVLHQLYSTNLERSQQKWRQILRKRLLIYFLKDLSLKQWKLPRVRGLIYAWFQLNSIYSKTKYELLEWYPSFQKQLIG